jgi:polysaccharide transporter, PST family
LRPFDSNGTFRPNANDAGELRRLAVRGAGATVFSQGVSLAVQMSATVILARLLIPADFGVVAMVSSFGLLLTSFPGFTEAVLQWEQIDRYQVSNLFWINLGAGVLLTIGFAAAGSLLAWFYGEPRVALIAEVLSFQIFLSSSSVLHLALLKRAMRFPAVSANDVVARTVAVAASISLAFAGWGYWALVAGFLAFPLSRSIGAWSLCRWIPSLPRRKTGSVAMVRFAVNVFGRYNVETLAHNMDNVLVGWRFGAQPLGFYKKAYDLFALPSSLVMQPLAAVAVAALSRFKQDTARYRRYLLRALAVTAFLGMGFGADLTLVGHDLIRLLLGRGWEESGTIFMLLGPGIGLMFLYATNSWIHLSIGSAHRFFRWGLIEFTTTCLLFALGLRWGPEGIALAWTASYAVLTLPAFWYAGRPIQFGIGPVVATVWKYIVAAVLAGCMSAFTVQVIPLLGTMSGLMGPFIRIVVVSALFVTLYLGGITLLHGSWAPLSQFVMLLREMLPSSWFARTAPAVAEASETADSSGFEIPAEETSLSTRS